MKKNYRTSLLKRIFVRTPKSLAKLFIRNKQYINSGLTYYPECEHKSYWSTLKDQLSFILQYGEVNADYYIYGLDVKGVEQNDFIPEFVNIDNLLFQNRNYLLTENRNFGYFNYLCLVRDKCSFAIIMDSLKLPIPQTIGAIINKRFLPNHSHDLLELGAIRSSEGDMMIKPATGNSGNGILHIINRGGQLFYKGSAISETEFCNLLTDRVYLVQAYIIQHPAMKALCSSSVNTLRVTVAQTHSGPQVLGVMCLMGARNAEYSNWHYGGVCVNVNPDGTLGKYGFSFSDRRIIRHPDSGILFENYKIPFYEEIIDLSIKGLNMFYGLKTIGWDFAITEDGPVFVEGNDGWGLAAHQMVENRGWAKLYKDVF